MADVVDADQVQVELDAIVEAACDQIGGCNGRSTLYVHSDGRAVEVEIRRAGRPSLLERWGHAQIVTFLFGWLLEP